jgi:Na+-transporting methylmalonyl-CoA/oxaloacetate decarboxylase beta subunit
MPDPHQEIADLEAEIDALVDAAERCRKIIVLAKAAIATGGLLVVITLTGLIRFGPLALEIATTALLGGIALFGSHTSTRDQIMAKVRTHEARRAAVIGGIELQSVGEN